MKQPQQDFEVDYVDRLGGILLKLISPEWFKAIFRKSYGTLLLLAIYAGCTVGAVLSADYKVLSTILFILPWLCILSFVLGDITQFAYNKDKDDDKKIGSFRVIVSYVLLALSNGGMYTMLWLWDRDSFTVIENASAFVAWAKLAPTGMLVAPGVGFATVTTASVGSFWIVASLAIFTQILFAFVFVKAFMDSDQSRNSEEEEAQPLPTPAPYRLHAQGSRFFYQQ